MSLPQICSIFYLNNACDICTLLRALRQWTSYACRFYSVVCYSCMAHKFSFEWNKEVLDLVRFGLNTNLVHGSNFAHGRRES